jgi:PAS domain S-box-containing protein
MRVLVIEDDGATRALLISTLRARRHDVVACEDAEGAWSALGPETRPAIFDLAVIDVGLPGQDGIAFCRQFRRHPGGRHAAVLLVTGDERPETLEAALDAGVHDYLLKPVDRRALTIRLAIAEQRSLANATSRYSREALRESESRFEAFMSNSPAAAFIKDAHGRYLYVNKGYLTALEVTESDRIGRTHFEVYPPEVATAFQQCDDIVLATGQSHENLDRVPTKDGVHDWLTYRFPLNDNQGKPTLVAALAIDVTARLRAERALQAQATQLRNEQARAETVLRFAARLSALGDFRSVLDAVCTEARAALGTATVALTLRDEGTGAMRLAAASGLGADALAVFGDIPREAWEATMPSYAPVLVVSDLATHVAPDRRPSVERAGLRSGMSALVKREGRIVGTLGVWTREPRAFTNDEQALLQGLADQAGLAITNTQLLDDVRRAETRARHERDRAEALLRISSVVSERADLPDTLQAVCDQTRLALGSTRASVLLYYPQEKVLRVGASSGGPAEFHSLTAFEPVPIELHERLAPLDVPIVVLSDVREFNFSPNFDRMWNAGLRSLVQLRMIYGGELVGILTAGEMGRFRNFSEEDQSLLRGIGDIAALAIRNQRLLDERRRAEEQMRNAQKLESLGVLAGGIAHDFNNLLVGVLGNAGLALMELADDSPAREAVKHIETSAQRAAELTRQMLAYSGKGKFLVEPINLSKIVEEMTQLLGRVISKQARLSLHLSRELPAMVGDATQVRQVVMNLITNASDALDQQPGLITLETGVMEADQATLAATYLNEQLPSGRYVYLAVSDSGVGMDEATRRRIFEPFFTTKFTGRGLGLAAVLGIVRGHRGAIDVKSEPGRGTTFQVLFPAATSVAAVEGAMTTPSKQWRGSGVVLLVDDEEAVRGVAARVLQRSGFEVVEAGSGEEAIAHCASTTTEPRAVVLDLTMPGLGGEATFHEIRRRWPALPVVVSSGYMPQEGGDLQDVPFLAKPYRPSELIDLLRRVLEPQDVA